MAYCTFVYPEHGTMYKCSTKQSFKMMVKCTCECKLVAHYWLQVQISLNISKVAQLLVFTNIWPWSSHGQSWYVRVEHQWLEILYAHISRICQKMKKVRPSVFISFFKKVMMKIDMARWSTNNMEYYCMWISGIYDERWWNYDNVWSFFQMPLMDSQMEFLKTTCMCVMEQQTNANRAMTLSCFLI